MFFHENSVRKPAITFVTILFFSTFSSAVFFRLLTLDARVAAYKISLSKKLSNWMRLSSWFDLHVPLFLLQSNIKNPLDLLLSVGRSVTLSDSHTAFESVLFLQKYILQTRKSAAFGRGFLSARGAPISLSHFLLNGQIEDSLILNNRSVFVLCNSSSPYAKLNNLANRLSTG